MTGRQRAIDDIVVGFFRAIEADDWATARARLTDSIEVAHGSDRVTLSGDELIAGWRQAHDTFRATRYQLGPAVIVLEGQSRATARVAARATFVRRQDTSDPELVIDGHYTLVVERACETWHISAIRHDES